MSQPNFIGPFHGRSELVNGKIMWAIYRGIDRIDGFSPCDLVAYFEKHQDATAFKNNAEPISRLIAAAPELLTWLKECIKLLETAKPGQCQGVIRHCTEVIARAEGTGDV